MARSVIKTVRQDLILADASAWPGNELDFAIPQSNWMMYELMAMDHESNYVNCVLINRADGIRYANQGTHNVTLTYSNGVLKVTLPFAAYWVYAFKAISDYH